MKHKNKSQFDLFLIELAFIFANLRFLTAAVQILEFNCLSNVNRIGT